MVTLTLENKSPPEHWRYLISDDTSTKNTINFSFPNLPRYKPWALDIPSRQVREGVTLKTVLNPVSILTAMSLCRLFHTYPLGHLWLLAKKIVSKLFWVCVWGLKCVHSSFYSHINPTKCRCSRHLHRSMPRTRPWDHTRSLFGAGGGRGAVQNFDKRTIEIAYQIS